MLKQYKKITAKEREVNQLQENIEQALNPIVAKQVVDGILIRTIALKAGSINNVSHKLGRKPVGYIIVSKDANSQIWNAELKKSILQIQCSINTTISIWVF